MKPADSLGFGPFLLLPLGQGLGEGSGALDWEPIAKEYSRRRQVDWEGMVVLYLCRRFDDTRLKPLVPSFWSLLVLAFTGWARRNGVQPRGIAQPEAFFLPSLTPMPDGRISFRAGGTGDLSGTLSQLPLPWGVDSQRFLELTEVDERIRFGCTRACKGVDTLLAGDSFGFLGAAADLAISSMEVQVQKIQGIGSGARGYILLSSAFEHLHRAEEGVSYKENKWHEVRSACAERVKTSHVALLERRLSARSIKHLRAKPGRCRNSIEFALEAQARCRNSLAHGREGISEHLRLPSELGGGSVRDVARLLFTVLLGQDLLELVGFPCRLSPAVEPYRHLETEDDFAALGAAHSSGKELDKWLGKLLKPLDDGVVV